MYSNVQRCIQKKDNALFALVAYIYILYIHIDVYVHIIISYIYILIHNFTICSVSNNDVCSGSYRPSQ